MTKQVTFGEKDSELIQKISDFQKCKNFHHLLRLFESFAKKDCK